MKIFYGEEEFLIEQEIKKIIRQNAVEPSFFSEDDNLDFILLDISTVSLFFEKKLIIIKNHPFIKDEKLAKKFLTEYLPNEENVELLLIWNSATLPSNELIAFCKQTDKIQKFSKVEKKNMVAIVQEIVTQKQGTISNSAAIKLTNKLPDDLRLIVAEIDKLLLINLKITDELVEESIDSYAKDDFFALSNALTSGDVWEVLYTYKERKKNNEEATQIIGQITSLYSLALQVYSLQQTGLSLQNAADHLNVHIFRVKKASELAGRSSVAKLKKLLLKLALLDAEIKQGKIDPDFGLDKFILDVVR